jgi:hypothetical protein
MARESRNRRKPTGTPKKRRGKPQRIPYKCLLNHKEYEALVRSMVQKLTASAQALGPCKVNGGAQNHVPGASGFPHQIDVTVSNPTDLLLIECKCWKEPVDVEPVLVLAARICDIRAATPALRVHGSIVSTKEPTAGAMALAKYFAIEIDSVRNVHEYALRVFNHIFAGFREVAHATDTIKAGVTRGSGS